MRGGQQSHGRSKKVRGIEVQGTEPGGGLTSHCSITFTVSAMDYRVELWCECVNSHIDKNKDKNDRHCPMKQTSWVIEFATQS